MKKREEIIDDVRAVAAQFKTALMPSVRANLIAAADLLAAQPDSAQGSWRKAVKEAWQLGKISDDAYADILRDAERAQ